jgi:hypothetical protein
MLKNPQNIPASRLALTGEGKNPTISESSEFCSHFSEVGVYDNCN